MMLFNLLSRIEHVLQNYNNTGNNNFIHVSNVVDKGKVSSTHIVTPILYMKAFIKLFTWVKKLQIFNTVQYLEANFYP